MTDLSIIIVSYRGWQRLHKCLDSLAAFKGENFSTEVIVVDNNSGDNAIFETEKHYPQFRFIVNKINGGFANGSNLGARNSSGRYILFLNPDTVASEDAVGKLLGISRENSDFTIVSCKQINERGKESIATGEFPSMFNLTGLQRAIFISRKPLAVTSDPDMMQPDWISGSVVLMSRGTFTGLNGFDEDYWMYFEDVDLCKRNSNHNGMVVFCRSVTIEHNHGGSSRINLKTSALTKTEVLISKHVYISKNKEGTEKLLIQIFLVANNLISGAVTAIFGLVFFFIPKLFARSVIFARLVTYYFNSLFRLSWISPRSVNFPKN
jgi:GT2 family glycosyltransferase